MKIGAVLASAVLQLHDTQWLGSCWGAKDIHFRVHRDHKSRARDDKWYLDPIVDTPYIHRAFALPGLLDQQAEKTEGVEDLDASFLFDYDKSLFSLGIVLLELWYQESFETLQKTVDIRVGLHRSLMEFEAAQELIKRIDREADLFIGAVRRCIRGLDCNSTSLSEEECKNEAHRKIVCELEKYWKACDDREIMPAT